MSSMERSFSEMRCFVKIKPRSLKDLSDSIEVGGMASRKQRNFSKVVGKNPVFLNFRKSKFIVLPERNVKAGCNAF